MPQQPPFPTRPAGISSQSSAADDPVTREKNRQRISPERLRHGPAVGPAQSQHPGELCVGDRPAERHPPGPENNVAGEVRQADESKEAAGRERLVFSEKVGLQALKNSAARIRRRIKGADPVWRVGAGWAAQKFQRNNFPLGLANPKGSQGANTGERGSPRGLRRAPTWPTEPVQAN